MANLDTVVLVVARWLVCAVESLQWVVKFSQQDAYTLKRLLGFGGKRLDKKEATCGCSDWRLEFFLAPKASENTGVNY